MEKFRPKFYYHLVAPFCEFPIRPLNFLNFYNYLDSCSSVHDRCTSSKLGTRCEAEVIFLFFRMVAKCIVMQAAHCCVCARTA